MAFFPQSQSCFMQVQKLANFLHGGMCSPLGWVVAQRRSWADRARASGRLRSEATKFSAERECAGNAGLASWCIIIIASLGRGGGGEVLRQQRMKNHTLSIFMHPDTCWILWTCVCPKAPLTFGDIVGRTLRKAETGVSILIRVWGRANWRTLPLTAMLNNPEHYEHIMTRKN